MYYGILEVAVEYLGGRHVMYFLNFFSQNQNLIAMKLQVGMLLAILRVINERTKHFRHLTHLKYFNTVYIKQIK